MNNLCFRAMHVVLVIAVFVVKNCLGKELVSAPFNVVPGGQTLSHVETWDGMSCEFSYVCQGGTLEEWQMMLTQDDKGNYVCKVSRPDGSTTSYLFFQSFKLEIRGARLLGAVVMGEGGNECDKDEYIVDLDNHQVMSDTAFKAHLNKVFAVFTRTREDL